MRNEERETCISYADSDDKAIISSYNAQMVKRLEQLLGDYPDDVTLVWTDTIDDVDGVEVRLPKKWIKIHPPRNLSDEQRQAMSDAAKARGLGRKRRVPEADE